jgi:hypothetical protein
MGDGLIPQAFSRGGIAPLPLFGADGVIAAAVAAENKGKQTVLRLQNNINANVKESKKQKPMRRTPVT